MVGRSGTSRSWIGLVVLLATFAAACSSRPEPSAGPMSIRLYSELTACTSFGGCAAYVSLAPKGGPDGPETRLSRLGSRALTQGLPPSVPAGTYTVRFRSVLVSDDIVNGQAPSEFPDGSCSLEISTPNGTPLAAGVEIVVVFRPGSCEATATYSVTMS